MAHTSKSSRCVADESFSRLKSCGSFRDGVSISKYLNYFLGEIYEIVIMAETLKCLDEIVNILDDASRSRDEFR